MPQILYLLCVVIGLGVFFRFWRQKRNERELLFGAAICLTLWITPHVMVYDWSLLLIPAIIFWEQAPAERSRLIKVYTLMWAAALLSGPFTIAQVALLPFSMQISLPVYAISMALLLTIPRAASAPPPANA